MIYKMKYWIICLLLIVIPVNVSALTTTAEEQRNALIETAEAYYRQKSQLQYDSYRKNLNSTPEDATSQHTTYTVCSGLTFQVYYQTLGIKIPDTTERLIDYAKSNKADTSRVLALYDSSDKIYSEGVLGTANKANYSNLVDGWVDILKPGDVIVVTGHAMLVESIDKTNRKITIIESAYGTRYDYINHVDQYDENGTVRYFDLTDRMKVYHYPIKNNGTLIDDLVIIRFITDGENYLDTNNTLTKYEMTSTALSRLNYPDIDIEKTVKITSEDKVISQNTLTNIGEYITYEINIQNNSTVDYKSFDVIENIDPNVVVTANGDGILNDNQLKWTISSLKKDESINIKYTVKVKQDKSLLGKIIVSTGKVDNIATSRIETLIGNTLTKEQEEKLYTIFEKLKGNDLTERDFINQIYLEALDLNVGLSNKLGNLDMIGFNSNIGIGGNSTLNVRNTEVYETTIKKYIYNNFYGLRIGEANNENENIVRATGQWNVYSNMESNDRARTITPDMLADGDIVLVYTDSPLVNKSYIYFEDTLYRKKGSNDFEQITGDELTTFLRNIIGENYIILKPSIALTSEENLENSNPNTNVDNSNNITTNPKTGEVTIFIILILLISIIMLIYLRKKHFTKS